MFSLQFLVTLVQIHFCSGLLNQVGDLFLLEEIQYCQVKYDCYEDECASLITTLDTTHLISFSENDCVPTLVVKGLNELIYGDYDEVSCAPKNQFIKNPNVSYVFVTMIGDEEKLNLEEIFERFPCIFQNQPYFYLATISTSMIIIEEVQIFTKKKFLAMRYVRTSKDFVLEEFVSVSSRRSNFFGLTLIAHQYVNNQAENGYHTGLANLVAKKFNFTIKTEPIKTFGVKLKNGTYSGTVGKLANFPADIGMAFFDHLPERLEVTEGGFTNFHFPHQIIYWNKGNTINIFGLIFRLELWIAILGMLLFVSLLVFFMFFMAKTNGRIYDAVMALITSLRLFLAMDSEDELHTKKPSQRILFLAFGFLGALLLWTYSGLLVSYFSVESEDRLLSTFNDLVNKPNLKLFMIEGSSSTQLFFREIHNNPVLEEALKKSTFMVESENQLVQEFLYSSDNNDIVLFSQMYYLKSTIQKVHYNPDKLCDLRYTQLDEVKSNIKTGWLYPKNSMLRPIIDGFLIDLHRLGIQSKLEANYWEATDDEESKCVSDFHSVGMRIMIVLFKLLSIGIGLATLTFIIEVCVSIYNT